MQTALTSDVSSISGLNVLDSASLSQRNCPTKRSGETVYCVGSHLFVREALSEVGGLSKMEVICFRSAQEYLQYAGTEDSACLILDLLLPDMSGLDLQRQVAVRSNTPVIFMSDQCDTASAVSAMKAGAIEFLTKPVDPGALIAAINEALAQDRRLRRRKAELVKLMGRYSLLTPREREVLPLVIGGLLNKQAASVLGISEVTLQIHRSQAMRKMQADSLAELVRMAVKLRIPYWRESQSSQNPRPETMILGGRSSSRSFAYQ